MSLLLKANIDAKIATHAALTIGIHGVGSLHIAGFHSAGEEVSKVIRKDASQMAMSDINRTSGTTQWTDLDLTAYTSAAAKFAIVRLKIKADTVGTGNYCYLAIRKNGTTPVAYPRQTCDLAGTTAGVYHYQVEIIGIDAEQVIEYKISVGANWQIDTAIEVLGYIE